MDIRPNSVARTLLVLTVAAFVASVSNQAHADDGYIEYADTVRYYDRLSRAQATETPAPSDPTTRRLGIVCAPPPHRHLGYVNALRSGAAAPGIVQITATPTASEKVTVNGSEHYITFFIAEVTGAAKGQTVNRAINDLN